MNQLVYLSYGKTEILYECLYSILSLLKFEPDFYLTHKLVVYTDKPMIFSLIPENKIEIRLLSDEIIKANKGPYDFVFRPKIEMLLDAHKNFEGKTLYCDSDIYFLSSPIVLFDRISQDSYLMTNYEEVIGTNKHSISRRYLAFMKREADFLKKSGINLKKNTHMWNAGVLGIDSKNAHIIKDVLHFTDTICSKFYSHITEQLAFSFCFSNDKKITVSEDITFHYWNFKEFRTVLVEFFHYHQNKRSTLETIIHNIDNIRPDELIKPKRAYEKLPFFSKALRKLKGKNNLWKMPKYNLEN
jgi:hypothetical protein